MVEELVSENKDLKEILGKDFKVTESNVFARDKTTGEYVSYTWHHDLKGDQMYLVRTDVHKAGTHMGPNSVINSLDKTGIDGGEAWDWREKHKISRDIKNYRQYDSSFKK
ncbi:HNH endonuclease [Leptotrichia hofstadii]|uniref:HNH endonuclease n=1 Tax=Leptotrichia hofstadii TaxID=157688 RepID=UPI003D1572A1